MLSETLGKVMANKVADMFPDSYKMLYLAVGDRCIDAIFTDQNKKEFKFWMDYDHFREQHMQELPAYSDLVNPQPKTCSTCLNCQWKKKSGYCIAPGITYGKKVAGKNMMDFHCINYVKIEA